VASFTFASLGFSITNLTQRATQSLTGAHFRTLKHIKWMIFGEVYGDD
jgi:hypothetical protein